MDVGNFVEMTDVRDGAQVESLDEPTRLLLWSIRQMSVADVQRALNEGANIDAVSKDDADRSALHMAAAQDSEECLMVLLGCATRARLCLDANGQTALHTCAQSATALTSLLLLIAAYGMSPVADHHGDTFLHCLMRNKRISEEQLLEFVRWLTNQEVSLPLLNTINKRGETVADVAFRAGRYSGRFLQVLLSSGAREAKELYAAARRQTMRAEDDERRRTGAAEKKHRRRLLRACARHHELLLRHMARRSRVFDKEEERRRRLWLCEHKERGVIAALAIRELVRAKEMEWERLAAERVAEEKQRIAVALLPPLTAMREEGMAVAVVGNGPFGGRPPEMTSGCKGGVPTDVRRIAAATTIWEAYCAYRRRKLGALRINEWSREALDTVPNAVTCIQAHARGFIARRRYRMIHRSALLIQRAWRAFVRRRLQQATDVIRNGIECCYFSQRVKLLVSEGTQFLVGEQIHGVMHAVTQLLWRENFCAAFCEIVFRRKRERAPALRRESRYKRLRRLQLRLLKWLLLVQVLLGVFMLLFIGLLPHPSNARISEAVDVTVCVVLLMLLVVMPLRLWRLVDGAIAVTALACACARQRSGVCITTLLALKFPFVVHEFFPSHSGTRTYCRAIEQAVFHFVLLAPLGLAGVGAAVRSLALNNALLSSTGNWGSVFLAVWSTLSPQYRIDRLLNPGEPYPDAGASFAPQLPACLRMSEHVHLEGDKVLLRQQTPVAEVAIANLALVFWTWAAVILGVHDAIRKHYDISDETKLRKNRNRFRDTRKMELLNEAHRAKNMMALEKQLDGLLWESDVRAAKEAIDASHYDHKADNTVHRFVRRVQDSVVAGEMDLGNLSKTSVSMFAAPITAEWGKWDCRNEHPESRLMYDIGIIEAALGARERLTFAERLLRRQWTGPVSRREMTLLVIVVLVMAAAKPNNYGMEVGFSAIFTLELMFSFYYLRIEFYFKHYIRLLIRLFCVVVGFVPFMIPFAVLRFLRFCEGWSSVFQVPGMTRYGFAYLLLSFFTMWMICFVAMWQFHVEYGRDEICSSGVDCLSTSVREMVLPAWTPTHIDAASEAPVACLIIVVFQLVFIPIAVTIVLHPLLHLSSFIGRFIRLVVQSLHHDVVEYIKSYVEGPLWFSHWRLHCDISARTITKLRMWVYDTRRRLQTGSKDEAPPLWASYFGPRISHLTPVAHEGEDRDAEHFEKSIISKARFASFEENEMYHNPSVAKHETLLHVSRALRQPLLHYAHAALTFTSIALLWVVDSSSELQDTAAVATIVVHATSMAASLVLIPRDASAGLTLLSVGTLAVALGLQYGSHAQLRRFFCLRFVSLLRLGQLCVLFFPRLLRFTRMKRTFFMSSISVLFPVIVTGCVAYVVELLRAQVYLVHYYDPVANNETTAWPLPKRLASNLRRNEQYPNEEDARQLFAYYFKEDAYIYLSLLDYWVLPACCVATALTHLRWTNANLLNSQCLMMDAIRLLEDPMALARFGTRGFFFRRVGHGVLVVGLLFGVLFSPSTHASADDYRFFFSMETFFTLVGLIDGFVRLVLAVHRCGCSWVACACMPKGLLDKELLVGNTVLLLAELLQLLYWSCALPIALTLLVERDMCLISPDDYAVFFVTLRFLLLLRMLPRQYVLSLVLRGEVFIFAGACVVVYFVGAASALADVHVAFWGGGITANLWKLALRDLCRQTFTAASPVTLNNMWTPPNYTQIVHEMVESNESIRVVATDYASSPLLLGLAVIGKVLIASLFGLTIGVFFVPLQSLIFSTMPKRALFLYDALRGGTNAIINAGARLHDDMRPENRKRIQERKFSRMYKTRGIPLWLLPHLLEELGMCKPGQQRRLMFTLEQLFVFLPIAEKRARCVAEYVDEWDLYSSGGPGRLSFSALPVYPAQVKSYNHARDDASSSRYVPPLRLVQAVALFESDFPPHSSVGSKIWLEFFKVAQRVRGATLMQSLWRMYVAVKDFENDAGRNRMDILMAWTLRRAFRRNRTLSRVSFLRYETFKDAVRFQQNIFNPGTGHYDVLDRLRGHFAALQPTRHLHLRNCLTPTPLRPRGTPPATRGNPLRGQEPLEVWCGVSYVPESSTDRDNTDSAGDVLGIQDAIFR